jgi:hypothetical protein
MRWLLRGKQHVHLSDRAVQRTGLQLERRDARGQLQRRIVPRCNDRGMRSIHVQRERMRQELRIGHRMPIVSAVLRRWHMPGAGRQRAHLPYRLLERVLRQVREQLLHRRLLLRITDLQHVRHLLEVRQPRHMQAGGSAHRVLQRSAILRRNQSRVQMADASMRRVAHNVFGGAILQHQRWQRVHHRAFRLVFPNAVRKAGRLPLTPGLLLLLVSGRHGLEVRRL